MAMTLLHTSTTTSGTSAINITTGIDSTYKLYILKIIDLHAASDGQTVTFQGSTDGASSFVNMTSTFFHAKNTEASGDNSIIEYRANEDVANSTPTAIDFTLGTAADESMSGEIFLFNPSNTTYVKHWYARTNSYGEGNWSSDAFAAGFWNTTSAINAVGFGMTSGNIDAAVIKLYGVG